MRQAIAIGAMMLGAACAAAQPLPGDERQRLLEQKIKLLELLLDSPAVTTRASLGAEDMPLAERGRLAIESARHAMAQERWQDARQVLDEVLKSSSSQSRRMQSDAALSAESQRQVYKNVLEQVETYRVAVAELAEDEKASGVARNLLARIDTQAAEARELESAGRITDANKILAATYKLAVGELSRLRAGQEVVMALHFKNPADEYAYELKRFESGEMLVGMMIAEGRAPGERQGLVDGLSEEGRRIKADAARLAESGRHSEAISLMEQATGQMNRALQVMGLPVF